MAIAADTIWQHLVDTVNDPYARAKQAAANGQKLIGITPMHFPEELVHASGAYPVVLQEASAPVTTGWSHMFPQFCAFSRTNVDAATKGELHFFDAIVISDMCVQTRVGFSIASRHINGEPMYLWWPLEADSKRWLPAAMSRLTRLKGKLEATVGVTISDDDLTRSIDLYNRNRELLREIYELRKSNPAALTGRRMQMLVQSGMLLPKDEHNRILEQVIQDVREATAVPSDVVPIYLSGHMCHAIRPEILDLVEDNGGVIVGDDVYVGYRYYAAEVATDRPPMEALALRFIEPGVPCPTKVGSQRNWGDYILEGVRSTGARGVISFLPKHCEPHMFYYPHVKDALSEAGVPHVMIETEHEVVSLEGVRTRIQALMETLKGIR